MEQKEKVLYQFTLEDTEIHLSEIEEKIYLISPHFPRLPRTPLNLPKPGGYDTSTYSSTYDERGEIILEFTQPKIKANEAVVDITITTTCEYWYYGSLGDDWHPQKPTINRKKLTVRRKQDMLDYRLEDIL